jgi:hypothetical protein
MAIYKTDFSVIDEWSSLELTRCDAFGIYKGWVSLIEDINTLRRTWEAIDYISRAVG